MSTALGLAAIVVLIAVTGVFVAAEFGLVAADRSRIATLADGGSRRARLVRSLLSKLSFQLSGAQLGITVTSLVLGFLAEPILAQLIEPLLEPLLGERLVRGVSIAIALALATVFQMVLGELIPKTVAIAKPETTVLLLAPFLQLYATVFGPIIRLLNAAANWTVRRLGIEPREELEAVRSLPELARLLEASVEEGTIGDTASTLFTRSVRFADKTAADALVPRVSVSALAVDDHVADLVDLAGITGFSRFPVYGADLDDIVGGVLVKSVHSLAPDERATTPVRDLMSEVMAVPETRSLQALLADMRDRRNHLAVVVDEYGGTAGVVTLEDVVEELIGEVTDEHDSTRGQARRLRDGSWTVPGLWRPDELRERAGVSVPDDPAYETVGGFVMASLGRLPTLGDQVTVPAGTLRVLRMDGRRVDLIRFTPDRPDEGASA